MATTPGVFDEDLSADEQAALATLDSEGGAAPAEAPGSAPEPVPATPAAPPAPSDPAVPPAPPAAPPANEDEQFQAFMARHQGKSPEEMARIAFQQGQRANREAMQGRQTQQQIDAARTRASEALAAKKAEIAARRTQFDADLAADPDGATRALHERLLSDEERQAEAEAHSARLDGAIALASAAIPDFQQRAPEIYAFGGEMGYSKEELAGISDGRDLTVLYLAGLAGRMIKGGLMDVRGQMIAPPQAVAATDPRLTAPAPVQTLSSVPARSGGGAKSPEQEASDLLGLSDKDFAKMSEADVERVLRQLGG